LFANLFLWYQKVWKHYLLNDQYENKYLKRMFSHLDRTFVPEDVAIGFFLNKYWLVGIMRDLPQGLFKDLRSLICERDKHTEELEKKVLLKIACMYSFFSLITANMSIRKWHVINTVVIKIPFCWCFTKWP